MLTSRMSPLVIPVVFLACSVFSHPASTNQDEQPVQLFAETHAVPISHDPTLEQHLNEISKTLSDN